MNYRIIISLYFLVFACSCSGDKERDDVPPSQRTVLVYMAADNNLYKNAKADVAEMLLSEIPANSHLLVYLDAPERSENAYPQLLEIQQGNMIPVKQYELQNSASGEVLHSVVSDAITLFPSETYGLVLWSHGTGWLPEGVFDALKQSATPRAFHFFRQGAEMLISAHSIFRQPKPREREKLFFFGEKTKMPRVLIFLCYLCTDYCKSVSWISALCKHQNMHKMGF